MDFAKFLKFDDADGDTWYKQYYFMYSFYIGQLTGANIEPDVPTDNLTALNETLDFIRKKYMDELHILNIGDGAIKLVHAEDEIRQNALKMFKNPEHMENMKALLETIADDITDGD